MIRFAINGMGRIGRALTRVAHRRDDLRLVAINDVMPADALARLLARDSVHGRFDADITRTASGRDIDGLEIDGRPVRVFRHRDPAKIPWREVGADLVVEATGAFTTRDRAARHLRPDGADTVLVTAITDGADLDLCPGLGAPEDLADARVVSALSCTSHCLALVAGVLEGGPGMERALMNEVHSYTADQRLLDGDHPDARRGRSAAINIVPTRSAAPAAVARLMPRLDGSLSGMAVRVPTPNVAMLELVAVLRRSADADELRDLYRDAADGPLAGLLAITEEPLVSSDVVGETASALVDLELIGGSANLCRIVAWYDNEWGYAHRLADFLALLGARRS